MKDMTIPLLSWFSIDDDYGIIGWGFECKKCGHENLFAQTDDDEVECEECGLIHISPNDPDE